MKVKIKDRNGEPLQLNDLCQLTGRIITFHIHATDPTLVELELPEHQIIRIDPKHCELVQLHAQLAERRIIAGAIAADRTAEPETVKAGNGQKNRTRKRPK